MKKLAVAVAVLILVLIGLVMGGALFIDLLAKTGVEQGATYALGVRTRADGVRLHLLDGRLTIDRLNMANPSGFDSPHLMQSGRFDLDVRLPSLFSETVVVDRFELDGLELNIEQKLLRNNVAEILTHLRSLRGPDAKPRTEGKKVKVDRIVIRNVVARFRLSGIDLFTQPVMVKIPVMELTNVTSDDPGGVILHDLVARMFPAVLAAVLQQGEGTVPAGVLRSFGNLSELLGGIEVSVGQGNEPPASPDG